MHPSVFGNTLTFLPVPAAKLMIFPVLAVFVLISKRHSEMLNYFSEDGKHHVNTVGFKVQNVKAILHIVAKY